MIPKHILSKSTFIKGTQCNKALYLYKHNRDLRDELTAAQEAIFAQGTSVGELACELFPGGVDCTPESYFDFQAAVIRTQEEIEKGTKIIYEAAFQFNGVLAALDILVKHEDGWRAYEVKSSTSVSETHELDATIQYYTITNSGIDLKDISIVHINNQYVKNGPIDVNELFAIESVKEQVLNLLPGIPNQVNLLKKVLKQPEAPKVEIGPHCSSPYLCDFAGHCWKHVPDYSIFNIARLRADKKFELYDNNILHLKDIPEEFPLNDNQWMQVQSEVRNETFIDKKAIRSFVQDLNYPIYHLDFETFTSAVPIFDGSRPYQQLVFQYSLHIEHKDGKIEHKEFLAETNGEDPRIQFIEELIKDCGDRGDVLVYNIGFERGKLFDLIEFSPQHKQPILKIIDRLKDLMVPFRERWYYTPQMQGSYSIKKVLPALVPELSYQDLNIQEGGTASNTFTTILQGEFKGDVVQIRKDLLAYCELDTLAMVRILGRLREV
ncbi:MAG TPA: DUF2779 domain-containing protein [Marinilabiliaceae bacterium]|nr:DUF2779 domain-containing protein [Marinilabiliaceae bacterium]